MSSQTKQRYYLTNLKNQIKILTSLGQKLNNDFFQRYYIGEKPSWVTYNILTTLEQLKPHMYFSLLNY